jgi:hypothetical protein
MIPARDPGPHSVAVTNKEPTGADPETFGEKNPVF